MALVRPNAPSLTRRALLRRSALAGAGLAAGLTPLRALGQGGAPAVITSERMRPQLPYGIQAGDLLGDRAILWARADRPAHMLVEWATNESFADARSVIGPAALENSDFTAKLDLGGLPRGQQIFYRVRIGQFQEFAPFWEFVSGPLNAGTFGPGELDNTFGPQLVFARAPAPGEVNLPPSAGLQFFGQVDIDAAEVMTVTLKDLAGTALFRQTLEPQRGGAATP